MPTPQATPDERVPPPTLTADGADAFRIENWRVFGPGFWKGTLFTPADTARIAANFAALSAGPVPALRPKLKLGHDPAVHLHLGAFHPAAHPL